MLLLTGNGKLRQQLVEGLTTGGCSGNVSAYAAEQRGAPGVPSEIGEKAPFMDGK